MQYGWNILFPDSQNKQQQSYILARSAEKVSPKCFLWVRGLNVYVTLGRNRTKDNKGLSGSLNVVLDGFNGNWDYGNEWI